MLKKSHLIFSAIQKPSTYSILSGTYSQQFNDKNTIRMAASRSAEDFIDMAEELDLTDRGARRAAQGGRKAGGGGGSGGRGNRAGGSGGGEMNREVAVSKALSKLLRHAAVDAGLKLDPEGFASVDQVVSIRLPADLLKASPNASSKLISRDSRVRFPHCRMSANIL
jgi:hypothetical protein